MPLAQTIGLETLSKYFHLPINDVAKELGVCATVLKKICRKNGIPRWPHRKIKSLDKMIMTLEVSVAKNPEDGERIRHEIHTLKNKKMFLMKNPNVLATKAPNMKKGLKMKDHSPIESPESPNGRTEHHHHSHHPYHTPYYPYPTYAEPPQPYPSHVYAAYNMYNNAAMKTNPSPYYPYPYPMHYPAEQVDHRRVHESEECLSPSMVLDPVAAALFLQIPHPHIPHPSSVSSRIIESPSSSERSQWVPTDHSSAFTAKSLRAKYSSPQQHQPGYLPDVFTDQQAPHMVPQHSPQHHPHHSPALAHHSPTSSHPHAGSDYLIQLPELRLPDEKDKPKLSTLEPLLFPPSDSPSSPSNPPSSSSSSSSSPSHPSPSSTPSHPTTTGGKWQLPEWFEAEQQQLMRKEPARKHRKVSGREESGEVPSGSDRTPSPLSVGE